MFTINNYDYECTKKCKCKKHGKYITSALTKRAISDDKLAAYIAKTCRNFPEITDTLDRTALQVAASVDRYTIVEWLLNHGALINAKDGESGSSALHRAIFYGCIDCAVLLMRYGASLDLPDDDYRVPLQHVCRLKDLNFFKNTPVNNELLVWGTNKNYNLGTEQGNNCPHFIDFFRKENISIESIAISTYHSIFLDKKGIVYSVGHGKGGRLGIGSENSLPSPKKVKISKKDFDEKVVCISCSKNHSLLVTNKGTVYSCGLNTDQQLGIKPAPEKLTSFKEITAFTQYGTKGLHTVIAREHHSIAYSNEELYVWGANHGQFFLNNSTTHQLLPRLIPVDSVPEKSIHIRCVDSNDVAIACCISSKQVLVYYNYKVKPVKSPTMEDIKLICLTGGEVQKRKSSENPLRLLVLTDTSNIYIWYEDSQKFLRSTFASVRLLNIDKILYKSNQIMLLSNGDAYSGKVLKVPVHNVANIESAWYSCSFKKDLCIDQKIRFDLKRIANVDRVMDIACDDDFESFAVVQENSRKYFVVPQLPAEEYNFKKLHNDSSEFDTIHDIVFHVDDKTFYVHKLIIYSRAPGLKSIVEQYQDKDIYLNFKNFTGKMFELILKHIYYNYLVTLEDLDEIRYSLGGIENEDYITVCEYFLQYIDKFELTELATHLNSFRYFTDDISLSPIKTKHRFYRLRPTSFPELYDVTIKCADREIRAHKCVLVTRLEYFNMMFNNTWAENKFINLSTIPYEYMMPIIEFLYTSDVEYFQRQNYSEHFLYNMIVICDQFFINRLRKVCELLILERVSIKKCGEMLDFGCSYNCNILKRGCLDFICQNLARVLLQHSLDSCEPESIKNINIHYRQIFKEIFDFRIITPDSDAVSDEILQTFVSDFSVDLEYKMSDENSKKIKGKNKINKTAQSKRNYEKEAISSMKEISASVTLFDSSNIDVKTKKPSVEKEPEEIKIKHESNANTWMAIGSKKDGKKNNSSVLAVKTNNILKEETKPKNDYINLNQLVKGSPQNMVSADSTPNKRSETDTIPPGIRHVLNFGDYTPIKNEKLSQKQRKRLSSESKTDAKVTVQPTNPIPVPSCPNPWNTIESPDMEQSSFADIMKSPTTSKIGQSLSPEKFVGVTDKIKSPTTNRRQHEVIASTSSGSGVGGRGASSFMEILEDERRQKEYCERLKSKPLVLTQIEETAISELREFYNVDNVDDEIITVERKNLPVTLNFLTWQRN